MCNESYYHDKVIILYFYSNFSYKISSKYGSGVNVKWKVVFTGWHYYSLLRDHTWHPSSTRLLYFGSWTPFKISIRLYVIVKQAKQSQHL